jgi:hypothetical protein
MASDAERIERGGDTVTDDRDSKSSFVDAVAEAIAAQKFVRLALGKYRGAGEARKTAVTLVELKGVPHLRFVTSFSRKDVTHNSSIPEALEKLGAMLGADYLSATLFSTEHDLSIAYSKKRVATLSRTRPTYDSVPTSLSHDRAKQHAVDAARPYLKSLGVTDDRGNVKPTMFGKFKQIGRFIEIVDGMLREADLAGTGEVSIIDIGSGKGYLTFALYDHLTTGLGKRCRFTGVEVRADLAAQCTRLAAQLGFDGLSFKASEAGDVKGLKADIVIALHACDTATDDAMAHGISSGAALIICAPCCQHELAPQLSRADGGLEGLLKFPLLKQREADLVTDAARALLLEAAGYKVKIIEFVATEHTAKNIMIAAVKSRAVNRDAALRQYRELKALTGFSTHSLESQIKEII